MNFLTACKCTLQYCRAVPAGTPISFLTCHCLRQSAVVARVALERLPPKNATCFSLLAASSLADPLRRSGLGLGLQTHATVEVTSPSFFFSPPDCRSSIPIPKTDSGRKESANRLSIPWLRYTNENNFPQNNNETPSILGQDTPSLRKRFSLQVLPLSQQASARVLPLSPPTRIPDEG